MIKNRNWEVFMNFKRKIALILLVSLILGLFGSFSFLLAMDKSLLPVVVLNKASLCGKCGEDFEVDQKGAQLFPCGCIIHDRCAPQLYYSEQTCAICDKFTNYFRHTAFKFVQPGMFDKILNRSELSLDLDPLILARALAKTNQNRLKQINTARKEYNVLMDAYNERTKDLTAQIVDSYMLRNYLNISVSASLGLIGMAAAYTFLPKPTFSQAIIPGGLVSLASYYLGSAWNQKMLNNTVSQLEAKTKALDDALKALQASGSK